MDPSSVRFVTRAQLTGRELQAFRAQLGELQAIEPGAALTRLVNSRADAEAPAREIDRVTQPAAIGCRRETQLPLRAARFCGRDRPNER